MDDQGNYKMVKNAMDICDFSAKEQDVGCLCVVIF